VAKGGKKRKTAVGDIATNRQASFRYELSDKLECGVELLGTEVKSLRDGQIVLKDGFAIIRDGELYLLNVHIAPYAPAARENHEPDRTRKLLAKRVEIDRLAGKIKERGLTLVPTRVYFKGNRAKVEIAVGRGKDRFDKREAIKERESKRDMQRALREANR
jgi:SsrA-binding protein